MIVGLVSYTPHTFSVMLTNLLVSIIVDYPTIVLILFAVSTQEVSFNIRIFSFLLVLKWKFILIGKIRNC